MTIPFECERRFLVAAEGWRDGVRRSLSIRQGYLSSTEGVTVRVRRLDDKAFLTVKTAHNGPTKAEFEYEIPIDHAEFLLSTSCGHHTVEKVRHEVAHAGRLWAVDEFRGLNRGLVLAEVELDCASQSVALPHWVGVEVTDSAQFKNSVLSRHPFSSWTNDFAA